MRKCLVSTSIRAPRTVPRRGTVSLKRARFSDSTVPAFRSRFLKSDLHYGQLPEEVPVVPISAIWDTAPYVQIAKRHERIDNTERQLDFTIAKSAAICSALRQSAAQSFRCGLPPSASGLVSKSCSGFKHRCIGIRRVSRINVASCTIGPIIWRHDNYARFQVSQRPGIRFAFVMIHPLEHDNRNDVR